MERSGCRRVRGDEVPPAIGGAVSTVVEGVPSQVRVAAAWSWRLLVIAAAALAVAAVVVRLSLLFVAGAAALLLAAGLQPVAARLTAAGLSRFAAAWTVLLAFVAVVVGAGWGIGRAVAGELDALRSSLSQGVSQVTAWLRDQGLPIEETRVSQLPDRIGAAIDVDGQQVAAGVAAAATTVQHVVTGTLLTLFVLFFFLADGRRVWQWVVRVLPRAAQPRADAAGQDAWRALTGYVRGMVVVALCDALLIAVVLWVVGVPLVGPLAALTFFGAFVPVIGAALAGAAAVLVALVDQGAGAAVIVAIAVLAVQWVDSDVLQPLVVGRAVEVHPLAIGVAVTAGTLLVGIIGAVVAVPAVAAVNTAVVSLRRGASRGAEQDAFTASTAT